MGFPFAFTIHKRCLSFVFVLAVAATLIPIAAGQLETVTLTDQPLVIQDGKVAPTSFTALPTRLTSAGRQEDPFGEKQRPPVRPRQPIRGLDEKPIPAARNPVQENPFGGRQPQPKPQEPETEPAKLPIQDIDGAPLPPGQRDPQKPELDQPPMQLEPVLPPDAQPGRQASPPKFFPGMLPPDRQEGAPTESETGGRRNSPPIAYDSTPVDPEANTGFGKAGEKNRYRPPRASSVPPYSGQQGQAVYPEEPYFVPAYEPIPVDPVMTMPAAPPHNSFRVLPHAPPVIAAPNIVVQPPTQIQPHVVPGVRRQPRPVQPAMALEAAAAPACDSCAGVEPSDGSPLNQIGLGNWLTCGDVAELGCPSFYFGFHGGGLSTDGFSSPAATFESETGSIFQFALGRLNGRNLRTELELGIRSFEIAGSLGQGDVSNFTGMANAYWEFVDFPAGRFRPYIGGGVGFASVTAEIRDSLGSPLLIDDGDRDTSFAYQWMAGLNYKAHCNLDLFVEYRFFEADAVDLRSDRVSALNSRFDFQASSVSTGLRWKF